MQVYWGLLLFTPSGGLGYDGGSGNPGQNPGYYCLPPPGGYGHGDDSFTISGVLLLKNSTGGA